MYCLFKKNQSDTWFYSRMLRKNEYCQKGHQKKENKTDQPNSSEEPGQIYDDLEEMPDYQQLGEISKPSTYDTLTLKQLVKKIITELKKKVQKDRYAV